MNHPQEDFSPTDFATLVAAELGAYYEARGTRFEKLFYFPGQDPFRHESPADAIATLYWGLSKSAKQNMTQGLVDVLATRMELVRVEVLNQVILSIGLIHQADLLNPLVRVIGQRFDPAETLHEVFSHTVAVIAGFGPVHTALDAARRLVNFESFPDDLVYDVLEFLIRDPMQLWSKSVMELLPRMDADYRPHEYSRVKNRLSFVAEEIGARAGLSYVVEGVLELIASDVDDLFQHRFVPRRDPLGILLSELFLELDAPFKLMRRQSGHLMLSSRDGKLNLIVEGEPIFRALAPKTLVEPVRLACLETA